MKKRKLKKWVVNTLLIILEIILYKMFSNYSYTLLNITQMFITIVSILFVLIFGIIPYLLIKVNKKTLKKLGVEF